MGSFFSTPGARHILFLARSGAGLKTFQSAIYRDKLAVENINTFDDRKRIFQTNLEYAPIQRSISHWFFYFDKPEDETLWKTTLARCDYVVFLFDGSQPQGIPQLKKDLEQLASQLKTIELDQRRSQGNAETIRLVLFNTKSDAVGFVSVEEIERTYGSLRLVCGQWLTGAYNVSFHASCLSFLPPRADGTLTLGDWITPLSAIYQDVETR